MTSNMEPLIPFLRNLADSIESKELEPKQLKRIGEFFMSYQFQEQAGRDMDTSEEEIEPCFSQADLVKFLSMGWYIYTRLLSEDTI